MRSAVTRCWRQWLLENKRMCQKRVQRECCCKTGVYLQQDLVLSYRLLGAGRAAGRALGRIVRLSGVLSHLVLCPMLQSLRHSAALLSPLQWDFYQDLHRSDLRSRRPNVLSRQNSRPQVHRRQSIASARPRGTVPLVKASSRRCMRHPRQNVVGGSISAEIEFVSLSIGRRLVMDCSV